MLRRAALMACAFVIFAGATRADEVPFLSYLKDTQAARLLWRLEGRRRACALREGMTPEHVIEILGTPQAICTTLGSSVYVFGDYGLCVIFLNGRDGRIIHSVKGRALLGP